MRDKKFSWFKDIIDLGPFCDFSLPSSSPYLLSPLCHKGAKMPKKSHSFWKSDFKFSWFEPQSLRYLVRLWQMLRYDEKIQSWLHGSYLQFWENQKIHFPFSNFGLFFAYLPFLEINAYLIPPYRVDSIEGHDLVFNTIYLYVYFNLFFRFN